MRNLPDVHHRDRDIPPGKVLLAEYGEITDDDPRPEVTVLDERWCKTLRTQVRLIAATAGWAIAGSVLRWDNGYFAIRYTFDGAIHGRRFKTFEEALAAFNKLPD